MHNPSKVSPEYEELLIPNIIDTAKDLESQNLVNLSFMNLRYSVGGEKNRKQIINNVTGFCQGGQLTAIMGSSGAGKTTLLNIISCRAQKGQACRLSGHIRANGRSYDGQTFPKFAAYVMQNDILMETLTPKEAFTFVASLKYHDKQLIQSRVQDTIKALKLSKCQNVYIGGITLKGISGGERKRTSIGVELVTNPSVIILDEPTSGLDSFTAFQIIHLLKQLAKKQNRTIIMTIHQPSTDISQCFDKLLLLNQGCLVYQGSYEQVVPYFASIGFQCPDHSNPLDYILEVLNYNNQEQLHKILSSYELHFLKPIDQLIDQQTNFELKLKNKTSTFNKQILLIASRDFTNAKRNPTQFFARFIFAITFGLLQGGVFWQVGDKNAGIADIFSLTGSLFFLITNYGVQAVFYNILGFLMEKQVFIREENSQLYPVLTYFLGKQIIEFPLSIIQPIISCVIYYWMSDYNDIKFEYFIMHIVICVICYFSVCSLGMMVGSIFKDLTGATSLGVTFLLPVILFGGYYANSKTYWKYTSWLEYLSPLKYGFQAICLNEFKDKQFVEDPAELYGFTYTIQECLLILLLFTIGLRIISLILLYTIRIKLQ